MFEGDCIEETSFLLGVKGTLLVRAISRVRVGVIAQTAVFAYGI